MPEPTVDRDVPGLRYVMTLDGDEVGAAHYREDEETVTFVHTEIDDAVSGQGLGSVLVRAALEDARRRGKRIASQCPFVSAYLRRHPAES